MEIKNKMAISPDDAVYYVLDVIQDVVFYIKFSWNHNVYNLDCDKVEDFLLFIKSSEYDEDLNYLFEIEGFNGLL